MPFTASGVLIDRGDGVLIPIQPVSGPGIPGVGVVMEPPPGSTAPPSPPPTAPPAPAVTTEPPAPPLTAPQQTAATVLTPTVVVSSDGDALVPPSIRVPQGYLGFYSQNVILTAASPVTTEPTSTPTDTENSGAVTPPGSRTPPAGAATNPTQPVSSAALIDAPSDAVLVGTATQHTGYFGNVTEIVITPGQTAPTPPPLPTPPAPMPTTQETGNKGHAGSAGGRTLAGYIGPGTDPIPPVWSVASDLANFFQDPADPLTSNVKGYVVPEAANQLLKKYAEKLERAFNEWVKHHWEAPVQPTYVQTAEFLRLWETSDHPEATLLRRGFAIENDLASTAPGARRERLLGAISSLAMVLSLKTKTSDLAVRYLPDGGRLP